MDKYMVAHEEAADKQSGKFEARSKETNEEAGYLTYEFTTSSQVEFQHTVTNPQFRGQGIAELLALNAFQWALAAKLKVIPRCSYLSQNFLKKPKYREMFSAISKL
jgi:predicted GNAT family acetyltransferase